MLGFTSKRGKLLLEMIDADAVAALEDVRRWVELHRERIDRARLHENFLLERLAESGALDAVADIQVEAAGKIRAGRVDVDQLGREVGVDRGR